EPVEMRLPIDETAVMDQDYFIDPVGELVASVLDLHSRQRMRHIATIHVGIWRHATPLFPCPMKRSRRRRTAVNPRAIAHWKRSGARATCDRAPSAPCR